MNGSVERICQAGEQAVVGDAVPRVSPACPHPVPGTASTPAQCPGFILLSVHIQLKWES